MSEEMKFPDTLNEFIKQYSFIDEEQIYTNGSELIHTFRVKQWEEHKKQENQELKKELEENKLNHKQLKDLIKIEKSFIELKNQQKEFIEYLENEIDRLSRECSQIYEDSLGKTRLVSEDIFNEVDTILSKYKEITGQQDGQLDNKVDKFRR